MIHGIDISDWQDIDETPQMMDFTKTVNQGAKYIFIKASQYVKSPDFDYNWTESKKVGLLRSAYHFAHKYSTAKAQVELFFECMGGDLQRAYSLADMNGGAGATDQELLDMNITPANNGEIAPTLDFEESTGAIGLSYIKYFLELLDRLWNADKPTHLKRKPILYTGNSVWSQLKESQFAYWVLEYPLWISWPLLNMAGLAGIPTTILDHEITPIYPHPWKAKNIPPAFWQYSYVGPGPAYGAESKGLDLNVALMDDEALLHMAGLKSYPDGGDLIPVDPHQEEPPETVTILKVKDKKYLHGRATPVYGIFGNHQIILHPGTEVEVVDAKPKMSMGVPYIKVRLLPKEIEKYATFYISASDKWTTKVK